MVSRNTFVLGAVLALGLFCLGTVSVQGQNTYCVRAGATGAGNGSDWVNAYLSLPANLLRGDTYYIADGSYPTYICDDAVSGTTLITIKKATTTSHGTETGWDNSYGDGQAVFSTIVEFRTGYHVFDGQVRNEADWFDGNAYGFKVQATTDTIQLRVGNTGDITGPTVHGIQLRYIFVQGPLSLPVQQVRQYAIDAETGGQSLGLVIHRVYVKNSNNPYFLRATTAPIVEYSAMSDIVNNDANHSNGFNLYYNVDNAILRYNKVRNFCTTGSRGTSVVSITFAGGLEFYGNEVVDFANGDGVIGYAANYSHNNKIYNNTFVRGINGNSGIALGTGTNNVIRNNLWIDCSSVQFIGPGVTDHDYNGNTGGNAYGEANAQINLNTSTLFQNYAGNDFRLKVATAPGQTLTSPNNTDMNGTPRGADGSWDRGAFEFGPTSGGNLTANAGPDQSVTMPSSTTLVGSYVNLLGGLVSLNWSKVSGPGTVSFSAPSAATTSATFSSAGTYVLRLTATVLLVSVSDDVTVTVQAAPDTTGPTGNLTAPLAGTVVSNSITLSATASDNVGVAGVRFFVSGSEIFDDTAAPYSYEWDSRGVTNGSHQIYTQARDAAGNIRWSGTNTIIIANPPAALPAPSAYWNFNEGSGSMATDSQANNILTLRNGATTFGVGKFGTGLILDGIDDLADAPSTSSVTVSGSAISVATWVKLESNGRWQQIVANIMEIGAFTPPFFSWHLFGGDASTTQWRPQFQLVTVGDISVNVNSSANVNYGEWVHVVGVYDGSTVRIYVNGVDRGSAAQSGNILSYNQPVYIGAHGLPGDFAKGVIDEVRIYSQALSATQVQALFAHIPTTTILSPPSGLRVVP